MNLLIMKNNIFKIFTSSRILIDLHLCTSAIQYHQNSGIHYFIFKTRFEDSPQSQTKYHGLRRRYSVGEPQCDDNDHQERRSGCDQEVSLQCELETQPSAQNQDDEFL